MTPQDRERAIYIHILIPAPSTKLVSELFMFTQFLPLFRVHRADILLIIGKLVSKLLIEFMTFCVFIQLCNCLI